MKFVRIQCNGTMDECNETINLRNIRKILENNSLEKGSKRIQHIYTWSHGDTSILCYGYIDGSPGTENKHDLPPGGISTFLDEDSSVQLLYGDIFLVLCNDKILDFQVSDYGVFYNFIFDGFDDCDTDDEEEEEEEINIDEDYIEGEGCGDTDEEYEILSENSLDLEIDTTEY